MRNHYEVMGVARIASAAEIRARFKQLGALLHPDRAGSVEAAARYGATFAEVTAAEAVLGNAKQRAAYDKALLATTDPCSTCSGEGTVWKQKGFTGRVGIRCKACGGAGRVERKSRFK